MAGSATSSVHQGAEAEESASRLRTGANRSRMAALVFLLAFAYLCIFCRYTTIEPDEGIVLQGAERILHGQVLYRDWFSFLTPGSFYLQALFFTFFGDSFLVARSALALMGAGCTLIAYLLMRRVCAQKIAWLSAGLLTTIALPYRFLVLHNWESTLLACLAVYCAVRLLETQAWAWALGLGSTASLTVLFEQSKGVGLCLGLVVGFAAVARLQPDFRLRKIHALYMIAGLAWPWVVTLIYFARHQALGAMVADLLWPLQHYAQANRVPYGYQNWSDADRQLLMASGSWGVRLLKLLFVSPCFLVPVLPLVGLGLLVYWILQRRGLMTDARRAYYLVVSGAMAGLWLSAVLVRADIIHFMYLMPLYFVLLGWLFEGRDIPGRIFRAAHKGLCVFLVVTFAGFSISLLLRAARAPVAIHTRRGVVRTQGADSVLNYVEAHVPPGRTMLVYPYLPLYSYLTETFSPASLDYFQPGMNTLEQSQELVAALAAGRAPFVLFELSFPEKIPNAWPRTPLKAIASDPVADYIVHHYRPCQWLQSPQGWRFLFMVRKEEACPA